MFKLKGILGIILWLAVIAGIYFWEFGGAREELLYTKVYAVKADMNKGDVLTADNIIQIKTEAESVVKGAALTEEELGTVLGKAATHKIPANSQIVAHNFDSIDIVLEEGEWVCALPKDWILSMPQTLRRKDHIQIYAVKSTDRREETDIGYNQLFTVENPVMETVVIYAKDDSNREVVDVAESGERFDGTSKVTSPEVVMDNESFAYLTRLINSGYKFVLMYQ